MEVRVLSPTQARRPLRLDPCSGSSLAHRLALTSLRPMVVVVAGWVVRCGQGWISEGSSPLSDTSLKNRTRRWSEQLRGREYEIEVRERRVEAAAKWVSQPAQTRIKTGRNERCPCGSGLKYKHCHGLPGRAQDGAPRYVWLVQIAGSRAPVGAELGSADRRYALSLGSMVFLPDSGAGSPCLLCSERGAPYGGA